MPIEPFDALIVVDVQNDFCPGGALAVAEGDQVIPVLNRLIPLFGTVVVTADWHPPDHCSFDREPQFVDKSWPVHCVAGTPGAAFHPDLDFPEDSLLIHKATDPNMEAYSDFEDTGLASTLRERRIRRVFIGGLATDYCVKATALDALRAGFETVVIADACRGVDVPPGSAEEALLEMKRAGVLILTSDRVL